MRNFSWTILRFKRFSRLCMSQHEPSCVSFSVSLHKIFSRNPLCLISVFFAGHCSFISSLCCWIRNLTRELEKEFRQIVITFSFFLSFVSVPLPSEALWVISTSQRKRSRNHKLLFCFMTKLISITQAANIECTQSNLYYLVFMLQMHSTFSFSSSKLILFNKKQFKRRVEEKIAKTLVEQTVITSEQSSVCFPFS